MLPFLRAPLGGDYVSFDRDRIRDVVQQRRRHFDALSEFGEFFVRRIGVDVHGAGYRVVSGTNVLGDAEKPSEIYVTFEFESEAVEFDTHGGGVGRVADAQARPESGEEEFDRVRCRPLAEDLLRFVTFNVELSGVNLLACLIEAVDRRDGL
jgi:hypothetical protein